MLQVSFDSVRSRKAEPGRVPWIEEFWLFHLSCFWFIIITDAIVLKLLFYVNEAYT